MKKVSFKKNIFRFNMALILVLAIFMLMYHLLNQSTSTKLNKTIVLYDQVRDFYTRMSDANSNFKSYLYTENQGDYDAYQLSLKDTKNVVQTLQNSMNDSLKWRFVLLEQMVESYEVTADNAKQSLGDANQGFQGNYNELLNQYKLITKTGTTYYEYVTDQVRQQKVEIEQQESVLFLISLIIVGVGIVWMIIFSVFTVNAITKPLYLILNNIKQIKHGEYDLSSVSSKSVEMEELCIGLDDMAKSVQMNLESEKEKAKLKHQLLEQENENLKKDERLAQSELRTLQNQINPHFLFNTLNMISKTAYIEKAPRASDMVNKTSELLRYALDKANRTSDLFSEIQCIENYIYIQKKRFDERIDFQLEIDENLKNIQVPGMLIQPLVENAVKHGLNDVLEGGEIVIKVHSGDEILCISVSDNGKGLDTDVLESYILNDFRTEDEKTHLGLYNVIQRVRMFYGNAGSISFSSFPSCGFEVWIEIDENGVNKHV